MKNAGQVFVMLLMAGWACAAFVGCGRFTKPPQFVATMRTLEGGGVSVHPLFAFDINADGRCEVTYVDASGQVLCRVTGDDLPVEVADRYKRRLEGRRCSGETTICVSEDGRIKLTREELSDITAIIRAAPPDNSVLANLHPEFLSFFKTSLRE